MLRSFLSLPTFLVGVFLCSCAHAPYEKTDVFAIARASDIKAADKSLELGRYCFKVFDYSLAQKHFLKALDISEKVGYKEGSFSAYNNLGVLFTEMKNYIQAMSNLTIAYSIAKSEKFRLQTAEVLNNLAFLLLESELPNSEASAKEFLEKALAQKPDLPLRLVIENNQGLWEFTKGEPMKAMAFFQEVQKASESKNLYDTLVMSTCHMGEVFEKQNDLVQAKAWYNKALDMANFWEYPRGKIQALVKLGRLAENQKDWLNALLYYQAVQSIHQNFKATFYAPEDEKRITVLKKNQGS